MAIFRDRVAAGRQLAQQLKRRLGGEDLVVLGLPRGGVPVAFEVARDWVPRSTSSWCASSVCPISPSLPWARSAKTVCGS